MVTQEVIGGIAAIVAAYLLGSIPFAYIFTRWLAGKDIRRLGSGNVGGNNVFGQVGLKVAVPVTFFDVGKGALAVAIAHWLLHVPVGEQEPIVFLAAIAAVAGHMWSVYLRFSGGNGLSATFGALGIVMPWELLIVIGLLLVFTTMTRNLVLSVNMALLTVPISAWFLEKSWLAVGFSLVLAVLMIANFLPTARIALARAGSGRKLVAELLRRG